ncbi:MULTISPECIES: hypothetical protein [unclassified Lentimonas]|uniref:hypothetical protein n=1 Tax=unclassified Lentimonas TaxID=2630993 RepID=UPI0013268B08|nr:MULTISPECIES: hypothetical protein [unclassified Lentimonas]CAA6676454.1 Unannotated [Lentimonas sp. CC4]CAA6685294.1 Unannotated [Lentimonas sp. CC6]CAA7074982.1 Unannotated [Lentimonas sp. CC4]CAA7171028.1 Unannotated [Lentimonas sp. CC21]CAA7180624.1 Unannotated [Lentimonas sp. CC8]
MAWRIADYVEHGEIDNREKGRVSGKLWLNGLDQPIELELTGNPYRDLAGQRLRFRNPAPKPIPEHLSNIALEQTGVVGDITAARRVKVLEIEDDELEHYYTNKIPMPYHWGNCLYLEWHSVRNGRVVIEATNYELTVEPEASWQMSETEESAQLEANGRAMLNFMDQLVEAAEAIDKDDIDEDAPQSEIEADADAEAATIDLINQRAIERLKKNPQATAYDYKRILEEERERLRRERGEPEFTHPKTKEQEEDEEDARIEAQNSDFEEAMAKEGEPGVLAPHPLFELCQELNLRVEETIETNGWLPDGAQEEHPLNALQHGIWSASTKLAGALNGQSDDWPPVPLFAGNCLVRLKKARTYLKDALAALEAAVSEHLAEPAWLSTLLEEVQGIHQTVNSLINEIREDLKPDDDCPF